MSKIIKPNCFSESVRDFIRRAGKGEPVNTVNIANRFGWNAKEARNELRKLESLGQVRAVGVNPMDFGTAQNWIAQ